MGGSGRCGIKIMHGGGSFPAVTMTQDNPALTLLFSFHSSSPFTYTHTHCIQPEVSSFHSITHGRRGDGVEWVGVRVRGGHWLHTCMSFTAWDLLLIPLCTHSDWFGTVSWSSPRCSERVGGGCVGCGGGARSGQAIKWWCEERQGRGGDFHLEWKGFFFLCATLMLNFQVLALVAVKYFKAESVEQKTQQLRAETSAVFEI